MKISANYIGLQWHFAVGDDGCGDVIERKEAAFEFLEVFAALLSGRPVFEHAGLQGSIKLCDVMRIGPGHDE